MSRQLQIDREGVYAAKQIFSRSRIISFSHSRRFLTGVDLTTALGQGKRVLDYGCGDGSFIQALLGSGYRPLEMIGAEIAEDLLEDCRRRFPPQPDLRFVRIDELDSIAAQAPIDVIVCMEVLEHVVELEATLDRLRGLLAAGGSIVISVPVETGPVLLLKQALRTVSGWRGIGDYSWNSRYTFAEYARSMFAGREQRVKRLVHHDAHGRVHHCHKGFQWRYLEARVARRFHIRRLLSSPFQTLPPGWGSQVWMVAEKTGE